MENEDVTLEESAMIDELLDLRHEAENENDWKKKQAIKEQIAHMECVKLLEAEEEAKAKAAAMSEALAARPAFGLFMSSIDKLSGAGPVIGANVAVHLIWAFALVVTTYILAVIHYEIIK